MPSACKLAPSVGSIVSVSPNFPFAESSRVLFLGALTVVYVTEISGCSTRRWPYLELLSQRRHFAGVNEAFAASGCLDRGG